MAQQLRVHVDLAEDPAPTSGSLQPPLTPGLVDLVPPSGFLEYLHFFILQIFIFEYPCPYCQVLENEVCTYTIYFAHILYTYIYCILHFVCIIVFIFIVYKLYTIIYNIYTIYYTVSI